MTAPRPSVRAHSEEELLEQWEFLDRLVERQANLLRSGVQDSEELDEPVGPGSDPELKRQLEALRAELTASAQARSAAERRAAELEQRLGVATAELAQARQARADAVAALQSAQLEVHTLRERLESRRRRIWPFRKA
jgi:chromosome segregation ATPase